MQTRTVFAACLTAAALTFSLCACTDKTPEDGQADNRVVISVASDVAAGTTLLAYMDELVEKGELSYTVSDGLMTSINGKANTGSSYWMLYIDDEENANTAWGTIEYDGKTLASSALGAGTLVVKANGLYVWEYTTF